MRDIEALRKIREAGFSGIESWERLGRFREHRRELGSDSAALYCACTVRRSAREQRQLAAMFDMPRPRWLG